jgi:hypothetical protein
MKIKYRSRPREDSANKIRWDRGGIGLSAVSGFMRPAARTCFLAEIVRKLKFPNNPKAELPPALSG